MPATNVAAILLTTPANIKTFYTDSRGRGAMWNIRTRWRGQPPLQPIATRMARASTLLGLIISIISIAVMWALVIGKRKVGHALNSSPILADANCTLVCSYMSIVLLASSLIYELTGFGFVDAIGALGLFYFSYSEGKESFEKAAGMEDCCDDEKS